VRELQISRAGGIYSPNPRLTSYSCYTTVNERYSGVDVNFPMLTNILNPFPPKIFIAAPFLDEYITEYFPKELLV